MPVCETCGNNYKNTFEVVMDGKSHVFDSFECAISKLAPTCVHCGCRSGGNDRRADGAFFRDTNFCD